MAKEKVNLGKVQETLLIPLYFRSLEAKKEKPRIDASYDVDLINKIDYDFSKFTGKMSMEGCVVRSIILDREAQKYIDAHPDCVVINLGCGLCTRTKRLNIRNSKWYNIDFPDTIEFRNKLMDAQPNCFNIGKDILDESWVKEVHAEGNSDILIIIEGVFMYLTEEDIKKLINIIKTNYKKTFNLIEVNHSLMANNTKYHDTVKETDATFKWGIKYAKDLESYAPGIKYIEEWNYFDLYEDQGIIFRLTTKIGFVKNICNKIAAYEITSE
ncbi:polyketide synthesis O-methyltransferase [Neocallimastix lanati (nom. inval.)]|jgi:O-methyltransferase involved in polyketide biosynthesis|uniref:Polyketide synthesis O-methyltransferase n=1 Tax=Neocallimastix californiae TaxID=1754190 RepID=A0A1Y2F0A4_9FUNG|nr:polyketide synthesis O-methyltransferase [Neocallimastix sp. JGI-2020a]ORY76405.1 polyketide synthesis O-methyltransferase [Neocallimastix californiae]|eukprot:ORY76405.1 polyketide synthesis O-methyltransferase [Neocallimastix californiae]